MSSDAVFFRSDTVGSQLRLRPEDFTLGAARERIAEIGLSPIPYDDDDGGINAGDLENADNTL